MILICEYYKTIFLIILYKNSKSKSAADAAAVALQGNFFWYTSILFFFGIKRFNMINESLIGEFAVPNAHQILALNKLEVEDIRTYQVSQPHNAEEFFCTLS